jgi:hypothetical protein
MLDGRSTALKYDGFTSEPIAIDNGFTSEPIAIDNSIGQGDPLSMVLYQYYNTDLLDIPKGGSEDTLAYVDDTILVATADDFPAAHTKLTSMMTRPGGVAEWSKTHNSLLEYSKLALIDFAHRSSTKERTTLQLPERQVEPVKSTKYLGVIIDQTLGWKAQQAHAVDKGSKWATQIRRIAKPTWGITPNVKATVGLGVHMEMLTKHSGLDRNEKGDVPLGNPTLPKDSTEIAESPA